MTTLGRALLFVLTILVGALAYRNIQWGNNSRVPDKLYGVWKTDNPEYADRYFEIRADEIVIGLGGGDSSTQTISKVDTQSQGTTTRYVIHATSFEASGGSEGKHDASFRPEDMHEVIWSLDYDPSAGGTIRLQNPPKLVWRKAPKGDSQ